MPRKHQKMLQRARHSKAGWKAHELIYMVKKFGFESSSVSGSHQTFVHPELNLRITIPVHPGDELRKYYISAAVELIDEVLEYEQERNQNKENDDDQSS